jgi:hypothetical protein
MISFLLSFQDIFNMNLGFKITILCHIALFDKIEKVSNKA